MEAEGRSIEDLPKEIFGILFANLWEESKDVPTIIVSMLVCKEWSDEIVHTVLLRVEDKQLFKKSAFARGVAMTGNIHLLQWGLDLGCPVDHTVLEAAGEGGHHEMIEWLLSNNDTASAKKNGGPVEKPWSHVAMGAARKAWPANRDLLLWVIEKAKHGTTAADPKTVENPLLRSAVEGASATGQTELLEWLYAEKRVNFQYGSELVVTSATTYGQLKTLEWLRMRCHVTPKSEWQGWEREVYAWDFAVSYAAERGYLHILDWLKENFAKYLKMNDCTHAACRGGSIQSLEWLLSQPEYKSGTKSSLQKSGLGQAAYAGHLDLLKWAWDKWNFEVFPDPSKDVDFCWAVQSGQVELVQWVMNKGYQWTCVDMNQAILGKNPVPVMQFLLDNGCAVDAHWIDNCVDTAINRRCLEALQWLNQNFKIEWRVSHGYNIASNGSVEFLAWMVQQGCPIDAATFTRATVNHNLQVCKWLKENNYPINLKTIKAELSSWQYQFLNNNSLSGSWAVQAWLKSTFPDDF